MSSGLPRKGRGHLQVPLHFLQGIGLLRAFSTTNSDRPLVLRADNHLSIRGPVLARTSAGNRAHCAALAAKQHLFASSLMNRSATGTLHPSDLERDSLCGRSEVCAKGCLLLPASAEALLWQGNDERYRIDEVP